MSPTEAPTKTTAAILLAQFREQIQPSILRLGAIYETFLAAVLVQDGTEPDGRPKYVISERAAKAVDSGHAVPTEIIGERAQLRLDVKVACNGVALQLDRWLGQETERLQLEHARAAGADPAGMTEKQRIANLLEEDRLSRLPATDLIADANAALARGDAQAGLIRLRAARKTGELNPRGGPLADLAAAVDAVLDKQDPARAQALGALTAARREFFLARSVVAATEKLAAALGRNPEDDGTGLRKQLADWLDA